MITASLLKEFAGRADTDSGLLVIGKVSRPERLAGGFRMRIAVERIILHHNGVFDKRIYRKLS